MSKTRMVYIDGHHILQTICGCDQCEIEVLEQEEIHDDRVQQLRDQFAADKAAWLAQNADDYKAAKVAEFNDLVNYWKKVRLAAIQAMQTGLPVLVDDIVLP